ncbi:hypothetical protein JW998_09280 [candidate division KSB1 bacterium]|nr:hypothetical protein [candidate division KSB1 bacterium]
MLKKDHELFMRLLTKHLDYLYTKAIHLLLNAEKGDILVQQTMQLAYDRFPQFNRKSSMKKWLDDIIMTAHSELSP